MTSLLVELYDRHVLEKNVYQAFISDCDEILFLSLTKISNNEKLSLRQFIMEEVPHIQRVTFRQLSLEQLADQLDYCLACYDQVLLDVFGGDSLLALSLSINTAWIATSPSLPWMSSEENNTSG